MNSKTEKRNIALFVTSEIIRIFVALTVGGTIWQGLLLHNGFTATQVGVVTAVVSIAQVVTYLLSAFTLDKFKKPIKAMIYFTASLIVLFALIVAMCIIGKEAFWYSLIILITFCFYISNGFVSMLGYKIPYLIMDMDKYGVVSAICGWTAGLFTTVIGIILPIILSIVGYMKGMTWLYIVCIVLTVVCCFIFMRITVISSSLEGEKASFKEIIVDKSVVKLIDANIARGLAMGVISCLIVMASKLFEVDSVQLTVLATLASAALLIANIIFVFIGKPKYLISSAIVSSLSLAFFCVVSAFSKNFIVFAVIITIMQVAYNIINVVIPVMLAQKTSYRVAGGVTSIRMMITMAASALTGWLTGVVLDNFTGILPIVILMSVAGLGHIYCAYKYCKFYKKY